MLEFLQTGKMLYVLAAVCALGTLSKLATGSLYKRLIRETGNMALTKDKNLKALKQRMENTFLVNHGIRNVPAYIEKQLYGFRFLHITLDGWDKLSVQAMMLCFMAGGAAAFGAYWYRCDSYDIVLYGAAGVFCGLFLAFVDQGVDAEAKRKQLADHLVDYVENSPHFYRNAENGAGLEPDRKKTAGASDIVDFSGNAGYARSQELRKERMNGRFSVLGRKKDAQVTTGRQEPDSLNPGDPVSVKNANQADIRESAVQKNKGSGADKTAIEETAGTMEKKPTGKAGKSRTSEADLAQSIAHLSESLRQIAAGREPNLPTKQNDSLEDLQHAVSPEDLQLLKTLLRAIQDSGS